MSSNSLQSSNSPSTVNWYQVCYLVGGIVAAVGYVVSFMLTSKYLGTKDTWNSLRDNVIMTILWCLVAAILLIVVCIFYFNQNTEGAMYFVLIVSILSLCLSYGAMCIAAVTRN